MFDDVLEPSDIVTAKVFLNEEELSGEVQLQAFTVSTVFNKIAGAKLSFLDGSISDRDFPLSNDDRFKPGSTVRVQLGYEGSVETVFEGIIVRHALKMRAGDAPELHVEAKDAAIRLTAVRKSAYFVQKTDSEVIQQLAADLQPEVERSTYMHKQLVQLDVTDWDFMVLRAEAAGMLVLTDKGKIVVQKPAMGVPVLSAGIGTNVRDFEAEMDARRQPSSVAAQSWNYTQQALEHSSTATAALREPGNVSSEDLGAVLQGEEQLRHAGHLTEAQLQAWADARAMRAHLAKVAGRVRIDGNAALKPGDTITIDGFGDRFNGDVYVTGVLHSYNGVWYSDIQFGWCEDWFYKKDEVMDRPAKGLVAGVNGLLIGVVTDLDDTDEGGQYRVKVKIPTVGEEDGIWARVATLDAGAQHGTYFRPQVADEAVLGFLNDDPREAVILGYLHSKDANQSPLPLAAGSLQYGIVTKEGMKVILDDTNKSIQLVVTAAGGEKSVTINDSSGAIEIRDEHSNTIKMEASGITIQAGAGNVTIRGTQVLVN